MLDAFKISKTTFTPEVEEWRHNAQRIVFMGTPFSVNITSIALRTALSNQAAIEVVDPQPIDLGYERIDYHKWTAADYVSDRSG